MRRRVSEQRATTAKGKLLLQSLHLAVHTTTSTKMFSRSLTSGVGATMRNVQVRQRNGDEETRNLGLTNSFKLGPTLHSSLLNPPLHSRRRRVLT